MSGHRVPQYLRQREKNRADRAYTRINGKRIKLGIWNSPESKERYASLLMGGVLPNSDNSPNGDKPDDAQDNRAPDDDHEPTVAEVMADYLDYARRFYRKPDGSDGSEYLVMVNICRYLRRFGSTPAKDFSPKKLKAVRQAMIEAGLTRKSINKQIDRVRRMFRWAGEEEMIPGSVHVDLKMVAGLRRGKSDAKETEPIRPVDESVIKATKAELPEVVADMVELQLLTGMRPGELCIMRRCDIDRESGPVWLYRPFHHKTEHLDHPRVIPLGKRAQAILLRYLARAADDYLFQPRDSEAKRRAVATATRKTPLSCGNRPGSNRKAKPRRQPGNRYTVDSYRRAIHRAAKAAKVEQWSPHRLRHTMATKTRREFGLDAVQAALGHRGAKISEVYAEVATEKAVEVALRIG